MNGRVNIMNESGSPFFLYEPVKVDDKSNYYNATKYMFQPNELSKKYFSKENIELVHQNIKRKVYEITNNKYVIDNQDIITLKTIMRSIFLQYSSLNNHDVDNDIKNINNKVVDFCSKNIVSEITTYFKYKKDVSSLAQPIERPVYLHNDNTLEFKRFI